MSVWQLDASAIKLDDSETFHLHETSSAKRYLDGQAFVVSAMKGVGKTLVLKAKSKALRRASPSTVFLPTNELVDRLYTVDVALPEEALSRYETPSEWTALWRVVLAVMILRRLGESIPRPVNDFFAEIDSAQSASSYLTLLLRDSDGRVKASQFWPALEPYISQNRKSVAAFVDNIDEGFSRHTGTDLRSYTDGKTQLGALSFETWRAAQIGFIQAVVEIHDICAHIKIYGAVRQEALSGDLPPNWNNLEARVVHLDYSYKELRALFLEKLALSKASKEFSFARPDEAAPLLSFIGEVQIEHPFVTDEDNRPLSEDCFDYILRHTRWRTREIVEMALSINEIPSSDRNADLLRERVRATSSHLFAIVRGEVLPFWPDEFNALINRIPSNVMTREEYVSIEKEFLAGYGKVAKPFSNPLQFLFENGLLGFVESHGDGVPRRRQFFLTSAQQDRRDASDFAAASLLLVHPVVNLTAKSRNPNYLANPLNVIGHGLKFQNGATGTKPVTWSQAMRSSDALHVHVGAGQLGLGLVAPMLRRASSSLGWVVAQRRSDRWSSLKPDEVLSVKVVAPVDELQEAHESFQADIVLIDGNVGDALARVRSIVSSGRNALALFKDEQDLVDLLSAASSISTALGVVGCKWICDVIARVKKPLVMFPFENDETSVAQIAAASALNGGRVIKVAPDRICADLTMVKEASGLTLRVDAERYQRTIFEPTPKPLQRLFFPLGAKTSTDVVFCNSLAQYEYERMKKRYLVNHIHTVFALATMVQFAHTYGQQRARQLADVALLPLAAQIPEVKDIARSFAEVLYIPLLSRASVIFGITCEQKLLVHLEGLREGFAETWERFLCVPDSAVRILKQEVVHAIRKWRVSFDPLQDESIGARKRLLALVPAFESRILTEAEIFSAFLKVSNMYRDYVILQAGK